MVGFLVTAAVGIVVLLVALVFDGVLDALNVDFTGTGVLSGASLGGLLTGIGCGGVIGTSQGWGVGASILLGLGFGVVIGAVAIGLYRLLKRAEVSQDEFSLDRMIGTTGVVTAGAEPGARGLVQLMYLGSPRTVAFSCATPVATGESVMVAEVLGPDVVSVVSNELPHPPLTGALP